MQISIVVDAPGAGEMIGEGQGGNGATEWMAG